MKLRYRVAIPARTQLVEDPARGGVVLCVPRQTDV
jgi:hypothetical protein